MTENTRALLEQALDLLPYLEALNSRLDRKQKEALIQAIRAELAKPVGPLTTEAAVKHLCQALRDDLDFAWSWHCNVAMTAYDAGCPHDVANEGAARFMQILAGVDTREHPAFATTQAELAKPTPAQHDAPEVAALKAERDELLGSIKNLRSYMRADWEDLEPSKEVDAAIAKAEGGAA